MDSRSLSYLLYPPGLPYLLGILCLLLLRIVRERDVPRRSVAVRLLAHPRFLDELAFRREDLDAIVHTVAHVDETIVRHLGAVHRRAELLRRRRLRIVAAQVVVVGLV